MINKPKITEYETYITIVTELEGRLDLQRHDLEVEQYIKDDYKEIYTENYLNYDIDFVEGIYRKTKLERPQRGLRAKSKPIDDACNVDIKNKIKELIHRYKYNVAISTTALYEEFMEDLEELIK